MILLMLSLETFDIRFEIQDILYLEVLTRNCDLGIIDPFEKEKEFLSGIRVKVIANTDYRLHIQPESDFVSNSGSIIPIERLFIRVKDDYIQLQKNGIDFYEGSPTDDYGEIIPIDLKLKISYKDEPGEYRDRLLISIMKLY